MKQLLVVAIFDFVGEFTQVAETSKPNSVFTLADDPGSADVGFNGKKKSIKKNK